MQIDIQYKNEEKNDERKEGKKQKSIVKIYWILTKFVIDDSGTSNKSENNHSTTSTPTSPARKISEVNESKDENMEEKLNGKIFF